MWIRSQDKEILTKAVCIHLGGENHENCICARDVEGNRWYIGEYSTGEKALKVLDEIQKLIGGVFQMPSDDFDEVIE